MNQTTREQSGAIELQRWAWILGLAGLIPFVGHVAGLFWFSAPPGPVLIAASQILYAALIMTFLGALHWGIVLADPSYYGPRNSLMLVWSVLPSIYCWVAAQLTQHRALLLIAAGLVVVAIVDISTYRRHPRMQWFVRLRITLTSIATLCLLVTWWFISR